MVNIIKSDGDEIVLQFRVKLTGTLMEMEESILNGVNEAGATATREALSRFDTMGQKISLGSISLTSKGRATKIYETPYGPVEVKRHVYQTSKGGATYCPLDENARIVGHSTPRFAKVITNKYARLSAGEVQEDLKISQGRDVSRSFMQNLVEMVGSIAQVTEEVWDYSLPGDILVEAVATVSLSIDGTCVLMCESGYREAMTGTISLYDKAGERLHTIYLGASPEYGKAAFIKRMGSEIKRIKEACPKAVYVGIADGAKVNWIFLEKHTDYQILDFYHATEYLGKASYAINADSEFVRKEWLNDACHRLKHDEGGASILLKEMKNLRVDRLGKEVVKSLKSAITYFENQGKRMLYDQYVSSGFPIGSGVTEAACKTLVKQRLCRSGMRWKDKGARVILALRALVCTNGRFEEFWERINQSGIPNIA